MDDIRLEEICGMGCSEVQHKWFDVDTVDSYVEKM